MKTILCIDARRSDLQSLAAIVEHAGYRVLAAGSTGQALRIFSANHVDGVLLRRRSCSEWEAQEVQQHLRRVAPEVPLLLFDGPAEVTQSALPWMDAYMETGALVTTNA